jgi:hypothetical protein
MDLRSVVLLLEFLVQSIKSLGAALWEKEGFVSLIPSFRHLAFPVSVPFLLPSRIIPSRRKTRRVTAVVVAPCEDTTEVSLPRFA